MLVLLLPSAHACSRAMLCRKEAAAKKAKHEKSDLQRTKAMVESIRREMGGTTSTPAPEPTPQTAPARELLTLDDYEASRTLSGGSSSRQPSVPSANAWVAKQPAQDAGKLSAALSSTDAFPAIPGAKVADKVIKERQGSLQTQRSWKSSLAGLPDAQQQQNGGSQCATYRITQPPPPPPPPRSDAQMSREGSVASMPRAPPGLGGRGASVRASQHSSEETQSNSSLTSSFHMGPVVEASQGSLPVGAVYEDTSSSTAEPKLTKAQKKNLKRAERKARQTVAGESSESSAGNDSALQVQCMAAVAHFKAMCFLQGLMAMGFDQWLCLAAIRRVGVDGNAATSWILDRQSESFSGGQQSWHEDAESYSGPPMHVDVSPEMIMVERVCRMLPVGSVAAADVYSAVVQAGGNVEQALVLVLEQARQGEASWGGGHVGTESALAVLNDQ